MFEKSEFGTLLQHSSQSLINLQKIPRKHFLYQLTMDNFGWYHLNCGQRLRPKASLHLMTKGMLVHAR